MTKLFVGDYKFKALGLYHSLPRAATIIMPLMILTGSFLAITDTYPYETTTGVVLLSLTLIAIYFGFIHFWIFPAKWDNMDNSQKIQQGDGILGGVLNNVLTPEQWEEYNYLKDTYGY